MAQEARRFVVGATVGPDHVRFGAAEEINAELVRFLA
jgi:hypothetical protein